MRLGQPRVMRWSYRSVIVQCPQVPLPTNRFRFPARTPRSDHSGGSLGQ